MFRLVRGLTFVTVLFLLSCVFCPSIYASLAVGMEIKAGNFDLFISYDDVLDKYDKNFDYIRDSSQLLFDLLALFQNHYDEIYAVKDEYWIYLEVSGSLKIIISRTNWNSNEYEMIRKIPYKKLSKELLKQTICSLLPIKKCELGMYDHTFIYMAKKELTERQPNAILFGSFPSGDMSLNYVLRPPIGKESEFKKVLIFRKDTKKYFGTLE